MKLRIIQILVLAVMPILASQASGAEDNFLPEDSSAKSGSTYSDQMINRPSYVRTGRWGAYLEPRWSYLTDNEGVGYEYGAGWSLGVVHFLRQNLAIIPRFGRNTHKAVSETFDWYLKIDRFESALRYSLPADGFGPVFAEVAPGWQSTELVINGKLANAKASSPSLGIGGGIEGDVAGLLRLALVGRYNVALKKRLGDEYLNKNTLNEPSVDIALSSMAVF